MTASHNSSASDSSNSSARLSMCVFRTGYLYPHQKPQISLVSLAQWSMTHLKRIDLLRKTKKKIYRYPTETPTVIFTPCLVS